MISGWRTNTWEPNRGVHFLLAWRANCHPSFFARVFPALQEAPVDTTESLAIWLGSEAILFGSTHTIQVPWV